MMLNSIKIGLIVVLLGIAYNWHYGKINSLNKANESLQNQLNTTANHLNICEANLSKQALQGYIDGIGESNETIIIDFNDISY